MADVVDQELGREGNGVMAAANHALTLMAGKKPCKLDLPGVSIVFNVSITEIKHFRIVPVFTSITCTRTALPCCLVMNVSGRCVTSCRSGAAHCTHYDICIKTNSWSPAG